MLRDRGGRELILGQYWDYEREEWTNREDSRMPGQHAVSAVPVDWDADGDYDLVLGTASGQLVRWMNLGTRTEPEFAEDAAEIAIPEPPEAAPVMLTTEEEIQAAFDDRPRPRGHAMPEIADWDQDGAWDLVVGTDDGSVRWARNVGQLGAPAFAPFEQLVQHLRGSAEGRSGDNVQVDVADLDGDGRVDLIVGDQREVDWESALSAEERQRLAQIREQLNSSSEAVQVLYGEDEQAKQALDPATRTKLEGLMREFDALRPARAMHGFVWFYARGAAGGG